WTEEDVTFHGKYFTLEDVHPHLFPVQKPHPPIWIGAHAEAGVRRAGKYGDAYACPPETPKEEVARRYAIVRDGFALRGREFGPQPLRRNCLVADTREEAMVEYARVAQGRYLTYAAKGLDVMKDTDLENEFAKAVSGHAVIGSPDEVIAQLTDYVTALPVDPLLVRPQWPTMTADETVATLDRWGRDIVPAITAITPRRDIDEALLAPTAAGVST
ncbi:MAG TPA: LLM class flavin-dependent oxidoreductase, partial [Lapillicoccus sp.]|nr:LLM class flavin-dependent oxidoreductase [Lapillicoccus sp.]